MKKETESKKTKTALSQSAFQRLVMCDCGWFGEDIERIDLFCPECGLYVEIRKVIEIRAHSKFGGKNEAYTVSILFDDDTCINFEKSFTCEEAEAFASGIREGFNLRNAGIRVNT